MYCLPFNITSSVADIILDLEEHFDQCHCEDHESTVPTQWPELVQCNNIDATLAHLDLIVRKLPLRACRRLIAAHGLTCEMSSPKAAQKSICEYIARIRKGKKYDGMLLRHSQDRHDVHQDEQDEAVAQTEKIRSEWLSIPSSSLKEKLLSDFMLETGSDALRIDTCTCCSSRYCVKDVQTVSIDDVDLSCLQVDVDDSDGDRQKWPGTEIKLPFLAGELTRLQLDPSGVEIGKDGKPLLHFCKACLCSIRKGCVPCLGLANGLFLGPVSPELASLTMIEENMISLCRSKCTIVQLKEEGSTKKTGLQRGVKGHMIVYPQRPSEIAKSLPPTVEEITSPICVLFVGAHKPSDEWLRTKAGLLAVSGACVRKVLCWLKEYNPLYADVEINETALEEFERTPNLPFVIQHVLPSDASETLTSRYEPLIDNDKVQMPEMPDDGRVSFEKIIIADIDITASSNNLRVAAVNHIKR